MLSRVEEYLKINGLEKVDLVRLKMARSKNDFTFFIIKSKPPSTKQSDRMASKHVKLATQLPPRLTRFFMRYPPPAIIPSTAPPSDAALIRSRGPNPFQPQKHAITGRWHDPVFSLRRQADLVKLARQHGVEELLPFTVKGTEVKLKKRQENGLRVKGTGVGQAVKGKEWERTLKGRYVVVIIFSWLSIIY